MPDVTLGDRGCDRDKSSPIVDHGLTSIIGPRWRGTHNGDERMKRRWTATVATMVIVTGVAGCSGGDGEKAVGRACDKGSYEWFNVSRQSVLTDLGRTRHYDKGQKVSTKDVREVARYTKSVRTTGGKLSQRRVIHSLARHLKLPADELAGDVNGPSARTTANDRSSYGLHEAEVSDRYVPARAATLVEADFRYRCTGRGRAASGHVVTWQSLEVGAVACGRKPEKGLSDGVREAARLGCRAGDPAAA